MKRVLFIPCLEDFSFLRQTPGSRGQWGDYLFSEDPTSGPFEFTVVYHNLVRPVATGTPRWRTLLVTAEPEEILTYPPGYLAQFGGVITARDDLDDKRLRVIRRQQGLPWLSGLVRSDSDLGGSIRFQEVRADYDEFRARWPVTKTRDISVLVSGKDHIPGHRERLRFLECLGDAPDLDIDIFGAGHRFVADKWEAIAPYRFHIVLENSRHPDYWTEKLADCYLAGAFPLYYGCLNLAGYFPRDAYHEIDLSNPQQAIESIRCFVKDTVYETRLPALTEARERVLDQHNLFPLLVDVLEGWTEKPMDREKSSRTLYPMEHYTRSPHPGLPRRVVRRLRKCLFKRER